jgi:hypothetical protein
MLLMYNTLISVICFHLQIANKCENPVIILTILLQFVVLIISTAYGPAAKRQLCTTNCELLHTSFMLAFSIHPPALVFKVWLPIH